MTTALPRALHPFAWWVWALGLAVAISRTANPLLLALAAAVVTFVVAARRTDSPWARAFRLYAVLGAFIILSRLVLHVLVGLKFGAITVISLPTIALPSWAAGINVLGPVRLEGLLSAGLLGAQLAAMVLAIGAANALADPKRMLRALPASLHEIGTALVVSVTVAPQLAQSVQRVMRARRLRGQSAGGLRSVRQVALPVLQDTLDRSLALASSMDSRGYGRRVAQSPAHRHLAAAASFGGLIGVCLGLYGLLSASTPWLLGGPLLAVGVGLVLLGLLWGGRGVTRSRYRPDPWAGPEWLTAGCGVLTAVAMIVAGRLDPESLAMPLTPLSWPALPVVAVIGLLASVLPGLLTPAPPHPTRGERR